MDAVRRQSSKTRLAWRSTRIGMCMSPIQVTMLYEEIEIRLDVCITLVGSVPPHREKGDKNGAGSTASLSSPRGVAITYDGTWGDPAALIVYVADTDNHRIRKVTGGGIATPTNVQVTCFAGRCGKGTNDYRDSLQDAAPEPGYADGFGTFARFDAPRGLAVHHESGDVDYRRYQ